MTNSDDTVSVITTATGAVAAPVPTAAARGGAGLTPDGKHVYVPNPNDGTVSVIDTATGATSATITVGTNPGAVAITPDGKHAYVLNFGDATVFTDSTVSVIDTATGVASAPVPLGNHSDRAGDHSGQQARLPDELRRRHGLGASTPRPVRCRPPSPSARFRSWWRSLLTASTPMCPTKATARCR